MTPLAAVAAPVVLFTGISASLKADENLEKAQTMYAQAESACEQMKLSETLCKGIYDRSVMFNKLLDDLNGMFSGCAAQMEAVINKKIKKLKRDRLTAEDFTPEEIKLLSVAGSLAHAVKAVIDTPMLSKEGTLTQESAEMYDNTVEMLPALESQYSEVKQINYRAKPKQIKPSTNDINSNSKDSDRPVTMLIAFRNIAAMVVGFILSQMFENIIIGAMVGTLVTFLIFDTSINKGFFKGIKYITFVAMVAELAIFFWINCDYISQIEGFVLWDIVIIAISSFVAVNLDGCEKYKFLLKLELVFLFIGTTALALIVFAFFHNLLHFGLTFTKIIVEIAYAFFLAVCCSVVNDSLIKKV